MNLFRFLSCRLNIYKSPSNRKERRAKDPGLYDDFHSHTDLVIKVMRISKRPLAELERLSISELRSIINDYRYSKMKGKGRF